MDEHSETQPATAKDFALRAALHGLNTLEEFSENPHDFSKVIDGVNSTIRLLFEIEQAESKKNQ